MTTKHLTGALAVIDPIAIPWQRHQHLSMALVGAPTQSQAPGQSGRATDPRSWTGIYLLVAIPLSLFLYLNNFQEAKSFFGAGSASWLLHFPFVPMLLVSVFGAWMVWQLSLESRKWWMGGWLLLGATASALLHDSKHAWNQTAALILCAPAWISLQPRLANVWRHTLMPVGTTKSWIRNGGLIATAVTLSFAAQTLWICLTFPEFQAGPKEWLFLVGKVATLACGPGLLAIPVLTGVAALIRPHPQNGRIMLVFLGTSVVLATGLVLFNGLSILDPELVRPGNFVYVLALGCPLASVFCERLVSAGSSVSEGLTQFGRTRLFIRVSRQSRGRMAVPMFCAASFLILQSLVGRVHRYYEWGFGTSLFYASIGIACTWYLLTVLPPRQQYYVNLLTLSLALLGCPTFLPPFQNTTAWTEYTKFDNNLRSLVRAYYREHPRLEPEFQTGRRLLDGSFALMPTNLITLRTQGLMVRPMASRPYVFFIVADALRAETYSGGSPDHRYRYPGIAWMSERFVIYDNAWSSYNSTLGSYPAYLNGVMNPAWYQFTSDWPIQQDNTLARAADLAGYRCYNLATYDDEFARLWPTNTGVAPSDEGLGLGDPGVVFPRALQLLDRHCATGENQPALFYLHLYNLHQPLLRRPGTPLQDHGRHWMRALYEQNAGYFDQKLKIFLEALEERNILSKAMVIITGDHGEEVFDLGGLYHGWQINPWVMRVPLFIHYPTGTPAALPAGTISLRPVNLIDLAPTLCQVMGVSILRNSEWQGVNLLEPEPSTARSFLLLSWESPLVGRVSFSPLRMLVMNLESGEEEAFVPTEHGWSMTAAPVPPRELAASVNQELRGLFHYWRMDPEHGRYLPASITERDMLRRSH